MRIKGLPQGRADFAAGQICAVLANVHRTKDAKVFQPQDFLPIGLIEDVIEEDEAEAEVPETIDLEAQSKALMAMLGKTEDEDT